MSNSLVFTVYGLPAPQGSKRHVGNGIMVESSKRVKPWREDVRQAALDALREPFTGPVEMHVTFTLPRPKGHYRTGRNADLLRDAAPKFPAGKPDLDKLLRAVMDALTSAGVWKDDAQVVHALVTKCYDGDGFRPGADVSIHEATP
ncbi:MAG: RusA family crossover junction endodeoxyribonuclease [Acidimicrobiales bacterium]